MKSLEKMNPAYVFAFLVGLSMALNSIFDREGNLLLVICGLGFFNVIYILDKILKKL